MKKKAVLMMVVITCVLWFAPGAYAEDGAQKGTSSETGQAAAQPTNKKEQAAKPAEEQSKEAQQPRQGTQEQDRKDKAGDKGAAAGEPKDPQRPQPTQNLRQNAETSVSTQVKSTPHTRPLPQPLARGPRSGSRPGAYTGGAISLNFDDADVFSVIQTVFGEILRVNYVVDQRVKGRVTFRSVAPIEAGKVLPVMEVILRQNGVGVVEDGGLYRIVPIGDVSREPAPVSMGRDANKITVKGKSIIQVVPLSYIASTEVVKLITPFLTTTAIVIDIPTMNQIVLVDTDANVKRILGLIDMFDGEQTKKKKPQVYVYHIQNSKAKEVAVVLQQIFSTPSTSSSTTTTVVAPSPSSTDAGRTPSGSASQAARPSPPPTVPASSAPGSKAGGGSLISDSTKIIPDENLNLIVILALPEDYEIIKSAIQKIDIIPRQVLLEGVVAEVTLKDDLSLGVSWALQFNPGGMNGVLGAVSGTVGFDAPGATSTSTTGKGTFSFAGTVGSDFKTVIDMLATDSRAELLAVPHVLVSDNKEASIQVGEQVPIVTSETIASTTVNAQRTIQYKDTGVILKVKPRINEGGLISLEMTQEVSSYEKTKLFDDEDYIIVKKTEAKTNLVVQDGQTIIIGGLIRKDVTKTRAGIPLLSKIPVLGYLFGSTTQEDHRKELIILLTPRMIKTRQDAGAITSGYVESITGGKNKIKKDELLGGGRMTPPGSMDRRNGTQTPQAEGDGKDSPGEKEDKGPRPGGEN